MSKRINKNLQINEWKNEGWNKYMTERIIIKKMNERTSDWATKQTK